MTLNVVIVGAGPAALEAALALRHHAQDRVRLTVVAPETEFVYRPVSVVEPFAMGSARHYPLRDIARDVDATHLAGALAAVEPDEHRIALASGTDVRYDVLVLAVGARPVPVFARATTFWGSEDAEVLHGLVQDVEMDYVKRLAFVVPPGTSWPLPLYELALMTAQRADGMYAAPEIHLVTPEAAPLGVFGPRASASVAAMLEEAGVRVHAGVQASVENGTVVVSASGERLIVDRVVALPTLVGPRLQGVPADPDGFIPVDRFGAVHGVDDVYAAGDATDCPIKQGGIATQQADVVAAVIAARAGAPVDPQPFEPVLRGMLLTERQGRWLRDETAAQGEAAAATSGLWWPPTKIAGLWLGRYLHGRDTHAAAASASGGGLPIEIRLDQRGRHVGAREAVDDATRPIGAA